MIKNITSEGGDFTRAVSRSAEYHLGFIERLNYDVTRVDLVVKKDKNNFVASIHSNIARKNNLNSSSKGKTIHEAISTSVEKMIRQLHKMKAKAKTRKTNKRHFVDNDDADIDMMA